MTVDVRRLRSVFLAVGLAVAAPATAAAAPQVTPIAGLTSAADSIVRGPDGAMWLTQPASPGKVARISEAGSVSYPGSGGLFGFPVDHQPGGIAASGPTGMLWFLLDGPSGEFAVMNQTGWVTPGSLTYGRPTALVVTADGAVWMTVDAGGGDADAITRYNGAHSQTVYSADLTAASEPRSLIVGPDAALWFVADGKIGRMTTAGTLTRYDVGGEPAAIAAGPLDSVWYAQGTAVRRVGGGEQFTLPEAPTALAASGDGALWAAFKGGVARLVPDAEPVIVSASIPADAGALALAAGSGGDVWLTLDRFPFVVKISTPPGAEPEALAVRAGTGASPSITATINPNGLETTVTAEIQRPDGSWVALASVSAGAGTAPTSVEIQLPGLPAGTTLVRLRIANSAGGSTTAPVPITVAPAPDPSPTPAGPPPPPNPPPPAPAPQRQPPVAGKTAAAQVLSGTVSVRLPGTSRYVELEDAATIPLGTLIDAGAGTLALTTLVDGKPQTGQFGGGKFRVRQLPSGMTEIALAGELDCAPKRALLAADATKKKAKKKRLVWGKDNGGKFRTRGNSSVATVRGTEWRTTDTCAGTTIFVRHGKVSVWPRRGGRSRLVRAGQRSFTPRLK